MLDASALAGIRPMFLTATSSVSVTTNFVTSLIQLINACWRNNMVAIHRFGPPGSLVTRQRAEALIHFLKLPTYTHLFWIDGDVGFEPQIALRLLLSDFDVVGGAYPIKVINWPRNGFPEPLTPKAFRDATNRFPVNSADRNRPTPLVIDADGFMEVTELPTGFMVIKRRVIDLMIEKYPDLAYTPDEPAGGPKEGFCWRFFDTMVEPETRRFLSEDYAFCRRWRDIGGKVYLDTTANLTHQGSHLFEGDLRATMALDWNNAVGGVGFTTGNPMAPGEPFNGNGAINGRTEG